MTDRAKEQAYPVVAACGLTAFVDQEDAALVANRAWAACNTGNKRRLATKISGKRVYLHVLLLCPPQGVWVDHIDGDPLNCRKSNLRYCLPVQNARNRLPNQKCASKFKGVRWHRATGKWSAAITCNYKDHWLGVFNEPEQAAMAYDEAAVRMHGEFAKTNRQIFGDYVALNQEQGK